MIAVKQIRSLVLVAVFSCLPALAFFSLPAGAAETLQPEPEILKTFQQFQEKWMTLLAGHGMYGVGYLKVEEDPLHKGSYRGSYKQLGQVLDSHVRKTGNKGTPYVGVLKYNEVVFVCQGDSPEAAQKGTYTQDSERTVTEIFRYAKGEWIY